MYSPWPSALQPHTRRLNSQPFLASQSNTSYPAGAGLQGGRIGAASDAMFINEYLQRRASNIQNQVYASMVPRPNPAMLTSAEHSRPWASAASIPNLCYHRLGLDAMHTTNTNHMTQYPAQGGGHRPAFSEPATATYQPPMLKRKHDATSQQEAVPRIPNPRLSCDNCLEDKKGCDKRSPCGRCAKRGKQCIFGLSELAGPKPSENSLYKRSKPSPGNSAPRVRGLFTPPPEGSSFRNTKPAVQAASHGPFITPQGGGSQGGRVPTLAGSFGGTDHVSQPSSSASASPCLLSAEIMDELLHYGFEEVGLNVEVNYMPSLNESRISSNGASDTPEKGTVKDLDDHPILEGGDLSVQMLPAPKNSPFTRSVARAPARKAP